jgi:hypothetical protein
MTTRYYRIVDDQPRDGRPAEESTLRRWERREFVSTNEGPPPLWSITWAEGRRRGLFFPRSIPCLGLFSARAKRLFLRISRRYGLNSIEMTVAKFRLGEQDGVHCCETPQDVWTYLGGTIEGNFIVEFTGERIEGQTIAEPYGLQVRNVAPLGPPIPAEKFGHIYKLPFPEGPADFTDSVKYE